MKLNGSEVIAAFNHGLLSLNEARGYLGLPPISGSSKTQVLDELELEDEDHQTMAEAPRTLSGLDARRLLNPAGG